MITISKVESKDIAHLEKMLTEDKVVINDMTDNFLVVYENNRILGYGGYDIYGKICKMNILKILDRDLDIVMRDGLIKSLLNLADLSNLNFFILKKDENESLYKNIGFTDLTRAEFKVDFEINKEEYLYINIDNFFSHPCKCSKKD